MSRETNYFKIGLFTLIIIGVLIAFLVVLGIGDLFTVNQKAETYFNESVKGLNIGSAVKYRGVDVGKVEAIDIVSDIYGNSAFASDTEASKVGERYIYVQFSLYPRLGNSSISAKEARAELENYIKQGLRISLATQDLVGNVYLELNFTKPGKNPVLPISWSPKYLYIPSAKSTLSRFTDSIDRIFTEIDQVDFKKTIQDFDVFMTTATQTLNEANIKQLSAQTTTTLEQVGKLADSINNLLTSKESKNFLKSLNQDGETFKKTLGDISAAMNQLNSLASRANQLTASQQTSIVDTLSALKQMSINLETATETLKNNPSSAVFGQPAQPVDPSK